MNRKQPIENISVVRVELVKDWDHPYARLEVEDPEHLVSVLRKFLGKADREVFLTVNMSGVNEINSINVVSIGCLNRTIVHPREVFKAAILSNAHRIAIAHNHPSGTPIPSDEDIKITRNLVQCGEILDIKILDHIIIAGQEYLSFAEKRIGGL
jgi:DNA repair protein RadC